MARRGNERDYMTGRKKSALLLMALGPDIASDVYRHLDDQAIEMITYEIANLRDISPELSIQVIEEFYHTAMAKQYISGGGISTAKDILEKALGPGKAMEIIERLQGMLSGSPFDSLKRIEPEQLIRFLQNEHPQTIALVLSHLNYEQGAEIMSALDPSIQHDVAMRIATMDRTNPEIIAEVERVLERKLSEVLSQEFSITGGIDSLAELLNRSDRSTSENIMNALDQQNPELANAIKKQMFTFDDLVLLDDRTLQKLLGYVEKNDLSAALKGANDDVLQQVFSNVSSRMADTIREDIDLMGPIRLQKVEESQQKIITILRQLEENGEVHLVRPGDEDQMVG